MEKIIYVHRSDYRNPKHMVEIDLSTEPGGTHMLRVNGDGMCLLRIGGITEDIRTIFSKQGVVLHDVHGGGPDPSVVYRGSKSTESGQSPVRTFPESTVKVHFYMDGSVWCARLGEGNIMECPTGFGETPRTALLNMLDHSAGELNAAVLNGVR